MQLRSRGDLRNILLHFVQSIFVRVHMNNLHSLAHIVTSALKRVDLALYACCEAFLNGTLTYGDLEVLGVKEGMIGLVENDNYLATVSEETRAYVSDVAAKLADGTLTVQSGLKRYTKQDVLNDLFDALDPTK